MTAEQMPTWSRSCLPPIGPRPRWSKVLLESEGVPSLLQATGVNGPQLGVGLSPQSPQRVMVRAEHADLARRLLAGTEMEEDLDVDGLANAGYLDEARGRGPRSYGVIGAYARIWFWSFVLSRSPSGSSCLLASPECDRPDLTMD